MKTLINVILVNALLLVLFCCKTPVDPLPSGQSFNGIAISLKVLYNRISELPQNEPYPKELTTLGGITKVFGYVIDSENQDIVIFGKADSSHSPLLTENLIISFKNSYQKFNKVEDYVSYYSYPGCSIDPNPMVMDSLSSIFNNYAANPNDQTKALMREQWCKTCEENQEVRVMGVPFNSSFAYISVFADYDMKLLVDGSDSLSIPGFKSMTRMMFDSWKTDIDNDTQPSAVAATQNRFWFYPGANNYLMSANALAINQCQVTLLTEEEHLAKINEGARTSENIFAKRFAQFITDNYSEIASEKEQYAELEGLFRLFSLTQAFYYQKSDKNIQWFNDLLDSYKITEKTIPTVLPGRFQISEFEYHKAISNGELIYNLILPSCGGVLMEIKPGSNDFSPGPSDIFDNNSNNILSGKRSIKDFFWPVILSGLADILELYQDFYKYTPINTMVGFA